MEGVDTGELLLDKADEGFRHGKRKAAPKRAAVQRTTRKLT